MYRDRIVNSIIIFAAMAVLIASGHAQAANYPLQIIQPQPNLDTTSRFYKAYPGIPYEMRMGVIGGDYPFRYELTTAPTGMTIDAKTGIITWPNPTIAGSPHTVTARVTDLGASGGGMGLGSTQRSVTWTITVTTSGFIFVDAVNGHSKFASPAGDGTISNPFKYIKDFLCTTSTCDISDKNVATYANNFVYFRAGTYLQNAYYDHTFPFPTATSIPGGFKPKVWMAYPGEKVVLDFRSHVGISIENERSDTYFSGFELINQGYNGAAARLQTFAGKARYTFWKIKGHGLNGTVDGSVASHLFMGGVTVDFCCADYAVYQDNEFYADHGTMHAMVEYHTRNSLYENNYIHDSDDGGSSGYHGIGLKGGCIRCEVRGNIFKNIGTATLDGIAVWINGGSEGGDDQNEVRYNLMLAGANLTHQVAMSFNQWDGTEPARWDVYRNTFLGAMNFSSIDSYNGPYYVYSNVIVNSLTTQPDHINCGSCTARSTQIITSNNLTGVSADNIIDANGNLTSDYASFIGMRGHQLSSSLVSVPAPPTNLRFQ